ncbi:MAG: hypothetical protein JOZ05_06205, partial [Acetobacteraceae bacterium]|nr:hypothetical protein [Acetobacteraceae bacterium]
MLLLALAGCAQGSPQSAPIGYATPDEAFAALRVRPDVRFRRQAGWTVAEDRSNHTVWSFAPPGHLAYPAAVRRQLVERDGSMVVEVRV